VEADWLEAAISHSAHVRERLLFLVLAEVKALTWVKDRAKRLLHVLIGNLPVLVDIKSVEYLLELLVRGDEAPMVAEVLELPRLDLARLAQVQRLKGALQRFPLEFNFLDQLRLDLLSCHLDRVLSPTLLRVLELCIVGFERWVLDGVVSEVKTFTFMYRTAHPRAEIVVVQSPLLLTVQVLQDLDEVEVVKEVIACIAEVPHDVLCRNLAIFIDVKV